MIQKTIALFSLIGLCCSSMATELQPADDRWLLAKYDVNGDRVISATEIEHKRQRVFSHMDQNADGDVSFDEYRSLDMRKRERILQARFSKLDADSDGQLTGEEYASYLGSFDRLDQNGDGHVSSSEMSSPQTEEEKLKPEADLCLLWVCVRKSYR